MSRLRSGVTEVFSQEAILNQSQHHPNSGCAESIMPVIFFPERSANKWSNERSQVDAHIIDAEPCVTSCSPFRVKLADHGADVGLQQASAHDDQQQSKKKRLRSRHRQREMTRSDD